MGAFDDTVGTITEKAGDLKDGAAEKFSDLKDGASGKFGDLKDFAGGKLDDARNVVDEAAQARDIVGDKLSGLADMVLDRLQDVPAEVRKLLKTMQGVDTDRIRAAGRLWGDGSSTAGGTGELEAWATDLDNAFETHVDDVWAGDSKEAFEDVLLPAILTELRGGGKTESEKQRFAVIGKALTEVADEWEVGTLDVVEKLLTYGGIAVALATWETGWGAIIGIIIAALGVVVSLFQNVLPRLEAVSQGESSLKNVSDGKPLSTRLPVFPSNPNDWQFNP